jgi:RNA polymerase sigma-70 factor, ECF subfamily
MPTRAPAQTHARSTLWAVRLRVDPAADIHKTSKAVHPANLERDSQEDEPASDETLVSLLRAGEEAVFARLVDEWSPVMLRLSRLHVSTDASAEEVVQEAWIAVLRGLDRFEGRSRLRTWVLSIVLNIAKTTGVRERRTVPFSPSGEDDPGPTVDPERFQGPGEPHPGGWRQFPATWPSDPAADLLAGETRAVIGDALDRLPATQRAVMTLRDMVGCPAQEVCELLEIEAVNERVLLHRARARVRRDLELYFAIEPIRRTDDHA